jgi:hypothetical protein
MKDTGIRLSDEHSWMIQETGKNPTEVIREALDLYFNIPSKVKMKFAIR